MEQKQRFLGDEYMTLQKSPELFFMETRPQLTIFKIIIQLVLISKSSFVIKVNISNLNVTIMKNAINWFEIPAKNFERAKSFYENVLDAELETMEMKEMGMTMAFFPADLENGVGGGIAFGPGYAPSEDGSLIYLNGGDDLSKFLSRVENAGGKVVVPKTSIGQHGFMAHFIDTEGNKVAFHSRN